MTQARGRTAAEMRADRRALAKARGLSVKITLRLRGRTTGLYVTPTGRVQLSGDLLDITDRLTPEELAKAYKGADYRPRS